MIAYQEDITPKNADEMLSKNKSNRPIRLDYCKALARDMINGKFIQNGDAIRFDENGNLIDGQHRLTAIKIAGVTIKNQLIIRGLGLDAFDTIDSGVPRTNADRLKCAGVKHYFAIAATCRVRLCYDNGDMHLKRRLTRSEIIDVEKAHSDILQKAYTMSHQIYKEIGGALSVLMAVISFALEYNEAKTKEFVERVATGANIQEGDPEFAYRSIVIRNAMFNKRKSLSPAYQMQLLIRAVNKAFKGERCKILRWSEKEPAMDLYFRPVLSK